MSAGPGVPAALSSPRLSQDAFRALAAAGHRVPIGTDLLFASVTKGVGGWVHGW